MVIHCVIRLSLSHEIRCEDMEIPNNTALNIVELVQWHLGMLHRQGQAFLREVEHVEDNGLVASVLAMVDGAYHLHDGLALMHYLLITVLVDDGQFALHQHAVVHHGMVMPAQLLSGRYLIFHGHHFRASLQVVGQLGSIPALAGAYHFGGLHRVVFSHVVE